MTETTPNDDQFADVARRYMAEVHNLHLPSAEHRWHFEPASNWCDNYTCEWDAISAYSVGPDGKRNWEDLIPYEWDPMDLPKLLDELVTFQASSPIDPS